MAQPPAERRRRPASGEARASGRPAPPHDGGPGDGRTGTARHSRGIGEIVSAALRRAADALRGLAERLVRAVLDGSRGALKRAALAAVQAVLTGRNPVVAAVKEGFAALSTPMKIAVIVGLLLLAVLAPLLLLLLLLALAVAVVVISLRTPATA